MKEYDILFIRGTTVAGMFKIKYTNGLTDYVEYPYAKELSLKFDIMIQTMYHNQLSHIRQGSPLYGRDIQEEIRLSRNLDQQRAERNSFLLDDK